MNNCYKVEEMSDKTNRIISCDICIERFTYDEGNVPRLLPCGHTFCEGCIDMLMTLKRRERGFDYTVTCPRCLNETVIDQCSTTLPKNYNYLELIEDVLEKQNQKNQTCTATVDFDDLNEDTLKKQNQKKKTCTEHNDYVLDMFCHDDSQAICLKCAIYGEHSTHCYSRLSEFCNHKKTSMKYQVESAECLIRDCQRLREHVEAREEELADTFDEIEEQFTAIFTYIQHEIKETLDAKLKSVLDDLERCSDSQMTILDENLTALNVNDLERLKDKATSFLEIASEYEIAKETALPDDIQACLDEVPIRKLHTQLKYELKIDSCQHIVETMKDLINKWNCQVTETEKLTTEDVSSVLEKHSPSIEGSISVLFGEKEIAATTDSPFEGIVSHIIVSYTNYL